MNLSVIFYIVGQVLGIEGIAMALPCVVALIYHERQGLAFLPVIAVCLILGLIARVRKPARMEVFARESLISVALAWIAISLLGALPFVICGDIPHYLNAVFETVSGFTTTGSSILTDVEALSHCMLFWRSFTHWIGGMGILVLMLAIIPMGGGKTMNLMRAESPGPSVGKLVPKMKTTARLLYQIYMALTVAEILILIITRMPVFDAICISFGCAGTGGFGVLNSSLASYTPLQQVIAAVFMVLFGVNFTAYFYIISKKLKLAFGMEEVRVYLGVIAASVVLISINTYRVLGSALPTVRHAFIQVASIITTSGFSTVDFNAWPMFSKGLLVILMFIGACAGSTGGGLKVSRVIVLAKSVRNELRHAVQPREVRQVYLDRKAMDPNTTISIYRYFITFMLVFVVSVMLVSLENHDMSTTLTSVAATLNNIGPGLEMVGPSANYEFLSPLSKIVLIADMLVGRLELMPVLILGLPLAWKKAARSSRR
ncbi:MAG: TrkH family potassium uptake protein [Lachnospiraceae bacterium]|nr:TrkH family potassium uptake protein [Lachnospiraceae bacterium]